MFKKYRQAEEYLNSKITSAQSEQFPGHLGLERMREFLARLGNPQLKYKTIHVVGTAGKGSTSYFTAQILQNSGQKVGLHTSPHLQTLRERFVI
ncbi:MAG: bifunctional folylpolyglutamate synthase/dihydrofolate synthase, partial [Microgenomates group bacterium]